MSLKILKIHIMNRMQFCGLEKIMKNFQVFKQIEFVMLSETLAWYIQTYEQKDTTHMSTLCKIGEQTTEKAELNK